MLRCLLHILVMSLATASCNISDCSFQAGRSSLLAYLGCLLLTPGVQPCQRLYQ